MILIYCYLLLFDVAKGVNDLILNKYTSTSFFKFFDTRLFYLIGVHINQINYFVLKNKHSSQ